MLIFEGFLLALDELPTKYVPLFVTVSGLRLERILCFSGDEILIA